MFIFIELINSKDKTMKKLLLIALLTTSIFGYERNLELNDLQYQDFLVCFSQEYYTAVDKFMIVKGRAIHIIDLNTKQMFYMANCAGFTRSDIIGIRAKSRLD